MKLSRKKLRGLILKEVSEASSSPAEKCASDIKSFLDRKFGSDFGHSIFNVSNNNIDGALCRVSLKNATGRNRGAIDQIVKLIDEEDVEEIGGKYYAVGVYSLKLISIYEYNDVCTM